LQSDAEIEDEIVKTFIEVFQEEDFKSINPFIVARDNQYIPLVWLEKDINEEAEQKIVRIISSNTNQEVKQKIVSKHSKLLEPNIEESL
jgi:hypothetical protein